MARLEFVDGLVLASAVSFALVAIIMAADKEDRKIEEIQQTTMEVNTDRLTRCQYLTYQSGMVPRMGKDGKQICAEITEH